jgi:hypothetical protein
MHNNIFFQLWNPTGLINQVMSMELACGLSVKSNMNIVVHHLSNNGDQLYNFKKVPIYTPSRWYNPQRSSIIDDESFPHLSDLLQWNSDIILIDEKIEKFPQESNVIENMMLDYYYSDEKELSEDELKFAEGRSRLLIESGIHLKGTLGWYSRFFYNRDNNLDSMLSTVRFKDEYYEFAKMITGSIGNFVGGHIRLSDHKKMFNTTIEMFENGLSVLESYKLPIIISTDEPSNLMIQKNKHRFILLDEYIVDNFVKEFTNQKFREEVVFGLICNLIMHNSEYFIGTSGSTYTGYIQRMRNLNGKNETWHFFDEPKYISTGPYSWNGDFLDGSKKMWWREWPESQLNIDCLPETPLK